jgi:hypothetical protein
MNSSFILEDGEVEESRMYDLSSLSIALIISATSVGAILISIITQTIVQKRRRLFSVFRMWASGIFIGIAMFHTPTDPDIDLGWVDAQRTVVGVVAFTYLMMWWIEWAMIKRCMSHSSYKHIKEQGELPRCGSATVLDGDEDKERIEISLTKVGDLPQLQMPLIDTYVYRSVMIICFLFILVHSVMSGIMIGIDPPAISEALSVSLFCVRRLFEMSAFVILILDGSVNNIYKMTLLVVLICLATPIGVVISTSVDYDFWPIIVYVMATSGGVFLYIGANYLSTKAINDNSTHMLLRLFVFSLAIASAFVLGMFV